MKALRLLCVFLPLGLVSCGDSDPDSEGQRSGNVRFTDVTASSGISLVNVSGNVDIKLAIPENIGQGAAALDFDGDGDLDLFIANGDVFAGQKPPSATRCALYRNDGGFKFTDVTEAAGLVFDGWAHGAWATDFDGDGKTDLYVTCYLRPNLFFRNVGSKFEDVTDTWGGGDPGPSTAAAFFDADADGDLDLYVGNYVDYDPENPPNEGKPCNWKGLVVSCGPRGTPPAKDKFYENREGKLVEATQTFGFEAPAAYTLGCVTGDFDNDGDPDLYVANDSTSNYLFENQGDGKFREAASRYGCDMNEDGRAQAGMGVDLADVDNDGRFDLFVTNFSHDYNTLYRNHATSRKTTHFRDDTSVMDLADASYVWLSWGTRITDLDQDGWQDIIVVSGHVYPQVQDAGKGTEYAQPNQIFISRGTNEKDLVTFDLLPNTAENGWDKKAVSRGLVTFDADHDGDLDLLIVELDAAPTLLRNDTEPAGTWIGFSLQGAGPNRGAIGARLKITDSRGRVRWREQSFGGSFLSTSDPRVLCGLGNAEGPVTVEVRWPDGRTTQHPDLSPARYHDLKQAP